MFDVILLIFIGIAILLILLTAIFNSIYILVKFKKLPRAAYFPGLLSVLLFVVWFIVIPSTTRDSLQEWGLGLVLYPFAHFAMFSVATAFIRDLKNTEYKLFFYSCLLHLLAIGILPVPGFIFAVMNG